MPAYLVAAKMAKEDAPPEQLEEMKLEAAIMAQFTHLNVVGLIGQVLEDDIFLLVVQYCEHGSLLSWLLESAARAGQLTMINMCFDAWRTCRRWALCTVIGCAQCSCVL